MTLLSIDQSHLNLIKGFTHGKTEDHIKDPAVEAAV
jgi:hypothetical protein